MAWEEKLALAFGLDDAGWARHANPLSGWSRMATGLPVIIIAAWSRVYIGYWALALGLLAALWLLLNPRLFSPPADDSSWMSRGVLGEKIWMGRKNIDVPEARSFMPHICNSFSGIGAIIMVWGLVVLSPVLTAIGGGISWAFKMGFMHFMVQLYEAVVAADPSRAYRAKS